MARHLGPAGIGPLQSGLALAAIIAVGVELGLDGVLRRELVRRPDHTGVLLGTATVLRLTMLAPGIVLFLWLHSTPTGVPPELFPWLAATIAMPLAATAEIWFMTQDQIRTNVLAQGIVLIIAAAARIGLVLAGAGQLPFARVAALEVILLAGALCWALHRSSQKPRLWRWDAALARRLVLDSTPLLLTGLAICIYRRIDLVIITHLLDPTATGLYGTAIRVSELGYMAPMILHHSWFPRLARLYTHDHAAYRRALADLFQRVSWAATAFAIAITLLSTPLVRLVFGPAFAGAEAPLAIHVWTGVFIAHGIVRSISLNLDNRQLDGLWLALAGAGANVALNFLLVPRLGVNGAALAALGALFFNMAILPACFARMRPDWQLGWRAAFGRPI